jgi:outer membrane protein OmpA-like peptidoglycan-associated protein
MNLLTLAAAAVWLLGAPAGAQQVGPLDEPWSDYRYREEEIKVSRELARLQARIDDGELPKVEFDFDSDKIRPESYAVLDMIADLLLKHPNIKIRVAAHTCVIGTDEYNMELSDRRAKSVKTYLVKQGVPPPSIRFKGWGKTQPRADNSTEEGRAKNRRVEFRVIKNDWQSIY